MIKEQLAIYGGSPTSEEMISFGKPVFGIEEERELIETLRSGWIGFGKKSILFEKKFKKYVGSSWALSVSSCTAALHLALLVNGIKEGDEVITTPLTFAATINAIGYARAKPVLVDIDPSTFNITPENIEKAITPKTKAILPVHFGGLPVDMDGIEEIAQAHSLKVIYDAAHAIEAKYKGRSIGNNQHISCFSFYANKNLTTVEGGMLTGNNDQFIDDIKALRMHGLDHDAWKRYNNTELIMNEVISLGFKYNFTDFQAALGIPQIDKLETFIKRRTEIANFYEKELGNESFIVFQYRDKAENVSRHALHLFTILIDMNQLKVGRDMIANSLRKENIGVAVHYMPVHRHKYYRERWGYKESDFPVTNKVGDSILTLPTSVSLSEEDLGKVVEAAKKVFTYFKR